MGAHMWAPCSQHPLPPHPASFLPPRGRMAQAPPPWGSLYWRVCRVDARYGERGSKPPDVLIQSVRYHLACSEAGESPVSPHMALPGPRSRPTSPEIRSGSHRGCKRSSSRHVAATCVAWPVAGSIILPQLQSRPDAPALQSGNRGSDRV